MRHVNTEFALAEQAHILRPIVNRIDGGIGVDMIADVEPILRGVFCPVLGDIGEGGKIGILNPPVLRFPRAHKHEAVCLHFRCEIDTPFVQFHLLPLLVKRQAARSDSGDRKPDVITHLADVFRRAYPV